jgi:hypothetical protein
MDGETCYGRNNILLVKEVNTIIAHNGLALGEEADFEALNCLSALNLIQSTKLHLSTEPAFLPNACWWLLFYLSLLFVKDNFVSPLISY